MAKYVKKPVEIEAITFDELMRIGAENADTVVDCMPVKLMYNGYVMPKIFCIMQIRAMSQNLTHNPHNY